MAEPRAVTKTECPVCGKEGKRNPPVPNVPHQWIVCPECQKRLH